MTNDRPASPVADPCEPQAGPLSRATAVKVIVVGPGEAGKSTLISRLVAGAVNLAVSGRTVAMDHGMLRRLDARISLVGVPGQSRFAAVRDALAVGAVGAIWVHPAGEPADRETMTLLRSRPGGHLPYLVYVNWRAGAGAPPRFETPEGLAPPQAVLVGNLLQSALDDLVEAVWEVADSAFAGGLREEQG